MKVANNAVPLEHSYGGAYCKFNDCEIYINDLTEVSDPDYEDENGEGVWAYPYLASLICQGDLVEEEPCETWEQAVELAQEWYNDRADEIARWYAYDEGYDGSAVVWPGEYTLTYHPSTETATLDMDGTVFPFQMGERYDDLEEAVDEFEAVYCYNGSNHGLRFERVE